LPSSEMVDDVVETTLPPFLYSTAPPVSVLLKTAVSMFGFPETGLSEPSKVEVY
jgi:hypothetical protein